MDLARPDVLSGGAPFSSRHSLPSRALMPSPHSTLPGTPILQQLVAGPQACTRTVQGECVCVRACVCVCVHVAGLATALHRMHTRAHAHTQQQQPCRLPPLPRPRVCCSARVPRPIANPCHHPPAACVRACVCVCACMASSCGCSPAATCAPARGWRTRACWTSGRARRPRWTSVSARGTGV